MSVIDKSEFRRWRGGEAYCDCVTYVWIDLLINNDCFAVIPAADQIFFSNDYAVYDFQFCIHIKSLLLLIVFYGNRGR